MPRFFFDFRQGEECCEDTDGTEFATVEQAYLEAVKAAQDMWSELLRKRQDPRRCLFEVRSVRRELLFILPFQEVTDSCRDRAVPQVRPSFDELARVAHRTRKVSEEFVQTLHSVRQTLEESQALVRAEI